MVASESCVEVGVGFVGGTGGGLVSFLWMKPHMVGWCGFIGARWFCCGGCLDFVGLEVVGFAKTGMVHRGLIMISRHPFGAMGRLSLLGVPQVSGISSCCRRYISVVASQFH